MMTRQGRYTSRRGFTIIEALTVAGVIILLLSLAAVAASRGLRSARISSERHHLASIRLGVDQFKQTFNSLPPLVDDDTPVDTSIGQPRTITKIQMATGAGNHAQYSKHSIAYYLMGLLDLEHNGKPMDGAAGPAITRVDEKGHFAQRGAPVSAVFTGGEDARRVYRNPDEPERIAYLDQWGVRSGVPMDHAIRYYRWETHPTQGNPNLPPAVGKSEQVGGGEWVIENVELRSANYALISAGPDGMIDDTDPDAAVNKDNIVEVGR